MNNKQFYINIRGKQVEVTEEVYLTYYRSKRRERYYERDIKIGVPIHDGNGNILGYTPSKEDSFERLVSTGEDFINEFESVEDTIMTKIMSENLFLALKNLPVNERTLIYHLFLSDNGKGMSERKYSEKSGIPRKTISYRRNNILSKLKNILSRGDYFSDTTCP